VTLQPVAVPEVAKAADSKSQEVKVSDTKAPEAAKDAPAPTMPENNEK
jgi:hypothetical protein